MPELVRVEHVTRRFGAHVAVDDVSLSVEPGEIVGLLGANGAGKTTLIRMLLGLTTADAGGLRLLGRVPDRSTRRQVGYVPQGLGLYDDLTVRENVVFAAQAYGYDVPEVPTELVPVADTLVGAIGLGRQRRLAFALALAHRPALLVLDEPTSGVDPLARARLWDRVHAQAEAGVGVLVTTHYMSEAQQCDRLVLMSHGRVVAAGSEDELTGSTTAVAVDAGSWQRVFAVLDAAGLPVMLAGRAVRVAAVPRDLVERVLHDAGLAADVRDVPATLEEAMVALDTERARTP
ncbi:ABC transporter ATP-binding protein [Cellulomonas persica]|uniref:ABC transporter domain-containing protein n=1 Tax=Cellulomonas persica TaxID=76861 RepID=A0A510UPY8_9CELL|nr:ABC transporter ATP-binding protein [Cellulomonas persica]GEK16727.1 hypothetical protein CPE01_04600 [Cellulomonas persica]